MSKDYLDKWEERAKKNTGIIEQTKTKKMSKEEKKRSWFDDIEEGKNRFTLDDPMGKLVKEAFDLTKFAKKLNQNKDDE